jgi:hypothetical protein
VDSKYNDCEQAHLVYHRFVFFRFNKFGGGAEDKGKDCDGVVRF